MADTITQIRSFAGTELYQLFERYLINELDALRKANDELGGENFLRMQGRIKEVKELLSMLQIRERPKSYPGAFN